MKPRAEGFLPVARSDARVLVLGSMPGQKSLTESQYYAHPRNCFWPIMAKLLDFDVAVEYGQRLRLLQEGRIALWDVVASCRREGSLDSAIEKDSIVVNDFRGFFLHYRNINRIYFNGARAETLFTSLVLCDMQEDAREFTYCRLPSTSPAHAAMSFAEKLRNWQVVNCQNMPA
ncbi:MAG: DNA-deoxyinosine glycosylase [Pseudomonadales bacterium]